MTSAVHQGLNLVVANFSVLHKKLHHYHWFVTGSRFYTTHKIFQEHYEFLMEHVDDLAERLVTIGGSPVSTLSGTLELSSLVENQKELTTDIDMFHQLIADYETVIEEIKGTVKAAGDEGDVVTEDMLISMLGEIEKNLWMLRSFVK